MGYIEAAIGVALVLVMFIWFAEDIWTLVEDYDDHQQREYMKRIAEIKRRLEVADFMKVNGVITEEAYQQELAEINKEVDKLEEEFNAES